MSFRTETVETYVSYPVAKLKLQTRVLKITSRLLISDDDISLNAYKLSSFLFSSSSGIIKYFSTISTFNRKIDFN